MIDSASRDAWSALDAKLRPFVARRVRTNVDVDDVMQEVFLRVQRGLGTIRDEERFGPWVYQIARNAIVDHHRVASKHRVSDEEPRESAIESDADDRAAEEEVAGYLAPFIAMLPSPYREALTIVELEGLTQKQAAEMLGISLSGMKSRVQRGRALLRKSLEDCCSIALDARGRVIGCAPRADGRMPKGFSLDVMPNGCCEEKN